MLHLAGRQSRDYHRRSKSAQPVTPGDLSRLTMLIGRLENIAGELLRLEGSDISCPETSTQVKSVEWQHGRPIQIGEQQRLSDEEPEELRLPDLFLRVPLEDREQDAAIEVVIDGESGEHAISRTVGRESRRLVSKVPLIDSKATGAASMSRVFRANFFGVMELLSRVEAVLGTRLQEVESWHPDAVRRDLENPEK